MDMSTCEITSTARRLWNTNGFCDIATSILGTKYELSIVLIGDARSRSLNKSCRGKDTPTNVLSFPLTSHVGEIYLNVAQISREARKFGLTPTGHSKYLLIHGCLHLKGYTHGSTMEKAEQRFLHDYNIR